MNRKRPQAGPTAQELLRQLAEKERRPRPKKRRPRLTIYTAYGKREV